MPSTKSRPELIPLTQFAEEVLGKSRQAAYTQARRGMVPTVEIGGRLYVPRIWIDRQIDAAIASLAVGA